jgi:hypothetical protein
MNANRVEEFLHQPGPRDVSRKIECRIRLKNGPGATILGYTLPKCGKLCIFAGNNLF